MVPNQYCFLPLDENSQVQSIVFDLESELEISTLNDQVISEYSDRGGFVLKSTLPESPPAPRLYYNRETQVAEYR